MLFPYKQYDLIYVLTVGLLVSSLFSHETSVLFNNYSSSPNGLLTSEAMRARGIIVKYHLRFVRKKSTT